MFELMAPAFDEFIDGAVRSVLEEGATWDKLVQLWDKEKGFDGARVYSTTDPQVQLRMITENIPAKLKKGWYPFSDALGRVGRATPPSCATCETTGRTTHRSPTMTPIVRWIRANA